METVELLRGYHVEVTGEDGTRAERDRNSSGSSCRMITTSPCGVEEGTRTERDRSTRSDHCQDRLAVRLRAIHINHEFRRPEPWSEADPPETGKSN